MDETGDQEEHPRALPGAAKLNLKAFAPVLFGLLAFVCAAGAFGGGAYLSLGGEGIADLLDKGGKATKEAALKPTYEWIHIKKTIYQLDRREDASYVLAEFTIRSPIDKAEEVRRRLPEVEFALQTYIRELSPRELQGAMGLYNLRTACLFRARRILGRDAVDDILIGELLVE